MEIAQAVQRLKALREEAGISQAKLAAKAGILSSRLQNYESGLRTPDIPTLRTWARALGQEVVFEVRDEAAVEQAEEVAEELRGMDPARASLAARLVALAERADPAHLRAGIAAIEAIMTAAGVELPARASGRLARA